MSPGSQRSRCRVRIAEANYAYKGARCWFAADANVQARPEMVTDPDAARSQEQTFGAIWRGLSHALSRSRTVIMERGLMTRLCETQVQKVGNVNQPQYQPDESRDEA